MGTTKRWSVEILLDEEQTGTTQARARLDTSEDNHLHGHGTWRTRDDEGPQLGDSAAVAQALRQIADKLALRASA
jgi:Rv2632c-like